MKLSDFFSSTQMNSTASRVQTPHAEMTGAQTAQANRQIQSLSPGQTIQGEIVSRNGSEVQIRVSDDVVLSARVDANVQLEVGKNMTFEVRSNGKALTLSPLFANTAMDANVLKALNMASLPVNDSTVALTGLMMRAGLPIDRNSLQQIFREMNTFRGAQLSDLVDLHKLGLPVDQANLTQIASYKNLTHQLVDGMNTVLEALPETIQEMVRDGDAEGAAKMFQELLKLVEELPAEEAEAGQSLQGEAGTGDTPGEGVAVGPGQENGAGTNPAVSSGTVGGGADGALAEGALSDGRLTEGAAAVAEAGPQAAIGEENALGQGASGAQALAGAESGEALAEQISETKILITDAGAETVLSMADGKEGASLTEGERIGGAIADRAEETLPGGEAGQAPGAGGAAVENSDSVSQKLLRTLPDGDGAERYRGLLRQLGDAERGGDLAEQAGVLQKLIQQGLADKNHPLLHKILSDRDVQKLLKDGLTKLWKIKPEEVADRGKVDELYQRLDRQLKDLSHILEQGGKTESPAFRAVGNMSENLDFLQQLNQVYTYVQLPLRLQQGDANGDLYVYTNKRNLAARDGQISALLHLDMEHLGPVDVYVAMQAQKVSTRFFVQDDEMLDFLEAHMDLLTERLKKRGYDCSFAMQVRDRDEEPESGLNGLMAQEKGQPIAQYAFDMRA